ncbi:MAG: flagellar hook-length control protein FliK [Vallitaleaceae bacterium]|nr:flagellar hook-length control protein FliK [Vallitaleaceae bacterium]
MKIDPNMIHKKYGQVQNTGETNTVKGERLTYKEGQVVKGEVLDATLTGVKIKLTNGQILDAKLAQPAMFSIGDEVALAVKEASAKQVLLTTLHQEPQLVEDKLITILENAKLPMTEENHHLVRQLIENNLPISDQSLKNFIQLTKQFPEATVKQLIFMVKHDIPVSSENIQQLTMLENNEHALMKSITSLADDITSIQRSELSTSPLIIKDTLSVDQTPLPLTLLTSDKNISEFLSNLNQVIKATADLNIEIIPMPTSKVPLGDMLLTKDVENLTRHLKHNMVEQQNNIIEKLPLSDAQKLLFEKLETPKQMNLVDLVTMTKEKLLPLDQLRGILIQLKTDSTYATLVKGMLMSKDTLGDMVQVKDYYKSLNLKMTDLIKSTELALKDESGHVLKEAQNVKSSVSFLNALGKDFSLMHLPMLLQDQLQHSELYVLGDRKKGKDGEKSITALVRLDLVNLGHTDIHIKKTGKNLDIQFFMTDEKQISVVNENLYGLHNLLNRKGFNVLSINVTPLQKSFDVVTDFLDGQDVKANISRYTFDMRA